jgi:tRNA (guanine37-N1)-methyltransferase
MKLTILTLFPELLTGYFESSIMAKAVERGLISYSIVDFREFALDRHRTCDDAPYGGGAGMVIKPEPLADALDSVGAAQRRVVYPSPSGRLFNQQYAWDLSREEELIFICGRYEGVDQRIIDLYVDDEICIGDYVMSSGEIAALAVIDSVYRLLDGVISGESLEEESFTDGLLEYPQYTRPAVFKGLAVPDVLLSGNHAVIQKWRYDMRIEKTRRFRPDLLDNAEEAAGRNS